MNLSIEEKAYRGFRDRALNLLSRREHSEYELTGKLLAAGITDSHLQRLVGELKDNDYLSDHRFTEALVQNRMNRGYGPVKIRHELRTKGVTDDLIGEYLDASDPVWEETLTRTWSKKYGGNAPVGYKEWAMQARFLQSRGFTSEQIRRIIALDDQL